MAELLVQRCTQLRCNQLGHCAWAIAEWLWSTFPTKLAANSWFTMQVPGAMTKRWSTGIALNVTTGKHLKWSAQASSWLTWLPQLNASTGSPKSTVFSCLVESSWKPATSHLQLADMRGTDCRAASTSFCRTSIVSWPSQPSFLMAPWGKPTSNNRRFWSTRWLPPEKAAPDNSGIMQPAKMVG